jgi:hypothetical protein
MGDTKGAPMVPSSVTSSRCFMTFRLFKVKKGDANEVSLRWVAWLSSSRDLVEEFVVCWVWMLIHG